MSNTVRRYLAEALGTFTLVVIGDASIIVAGRTHAYGMTGIALAFGLAVTVVVSASGHLGGAHINPAVTLGFWSLRRFAGRDVIPYIVAQTIGAIGASLLLAWLLSPAGTLGATVPAIPIAQCFVAECGFTGILGFVIMGVATDARTPPAVAPFAIGATVFAGALVLGPLTGASFNPARSLGPAVVANVWTAHWVYWIAPIVGMMLGMRLYELLRTDGAPPVVGQELGTEGPLSSQEE